MKIKKLYKINKHLSVSSNKLDTTVCMKYIFAKLPNSFSNTV